MTFTVDDFFTILDKHTPALQAAYEARLVLRAAGLPTDDCQQHIDALSAAMSAELDAAAFPTLSPPSNS